MSIYAKIYITAFVGFVCTFFSIRFASGNTAEIIAWLMLISALAYPVTFVAWIWLET